MVYYKTDGDKATAARRLAEDYRDAAQAFTEARAIIASYDGKVFTKRLETALQESTGRRLYCRKEYERYISISMYSKNFNQLLTLASISIKDMQDGKRINAEKLLESGRENYAAFMKKAASLERAIETAPQIKAQITELTRKIMALSLQVDCYEAREIFDLNYRITTY